MFPTKSTVSKLWFLASVCVSFLLILPSQPLYAQDSQPRVSFLQALKEREEGHFSQAEQLFRQALQLEPENPDYHFELGNLYIQAKELRLARTEFEQTLMIAPSHLAAHYNLGLVHRELGFPGDAREEFRRVLQLDPSNIKAMLQIGYLYQDEGFYEEAREAFEEAYQMDITNPEPRQALEELGDAKQQAEENSQSQMQNSLLAGRQFLNQQNSSSDLSQLAGTSMGQPNTQQALVQAGTLLIQQLLSKKKDNNG